MQSTVKHRWILWLNGAAGAGKSAIARSVMQYCLDTGIPIARFFFFRSDPSRCDIGPVVATLVDQLMRSIPALMSIVIPVIESDPLIFTKSLETQFESLVFQPLLQFMNDSRGLNTLVFLFDGVDECDRHDGQIQLIRIVSDFIRKRDYPAIVFFASRAEPQLNATFREPRIADILHEISLDNKYSSDDCIRLFVNRSFTQIKNTHHLSHTFAPNWPSRADAEMIVTKSSGQFIFASVSLKFIATPHKSPAAQLKIILGLRAVENSNPFAQLDALYLHILSNVEDKNVTFLVLAWAMFFPATSGSLEITQCGYMLSMDKADVYAALAPLASVISCTNGQIHFLHASLPDFLCDQNRSGQFYMDRVTWCNTISCLSLRRKMDFLRAGMLCIPSLLYFKSMIVVFRPFFSP